MSDRSDGSYTYSRSHSRSLSQSYSHSHSHSRDLAYRTANEEKSSKQAKKLLDSPGSKDGAGSSRSAARGQGRIERERDVVKAKDKWAGVAAHHPPSPPAVVPFHAQHVVPPYMPPTPIVGANSKRSRNGSQLSMPSAPSPHHYLPHQPTTPPSARFQPPQRVLSAPMQPQFGPFREFGPSSPSHASFSARGSVSRPSSSGGMHHHVGQLQLQEARRSSRRGSKSSPKKPQKSKSNQLLMQRSAWPPPGYSSITRVTMSEMRALIGSGALEFEGCATELPFTENSFRYYVTVHVSSGVSTNKKKSSHPTTADEPTYPATWQEEALSAISLSFIDGKAGLAPDGSLEYPNMLYAFGKSPGTTKLTWYVGMKGQLRTPVYFSRTSEAKKRKMKLISILERLDELTKKGLEEHPYDQYEFLYNRLIEDPEQDTNPHVDRHLQIIDLTLVLMNKEWTDFSLPKNQVVAKFFDSPDDKIKQKFFHQLLLAVELHLRVQANEHFDEAKRKLLSTLPPKVLWDLALAKRWLENMTIYQDALNDEDSEFTFHLGHKKRQRDALRYFARVLKWPNMERLDEILDCDDVDEEHSNSGTIRGALEDKTADAMSWFTAVILPGPTLPFLLMNSLIDCDDDTKGRLAYLTHVKPSCGFQYRANTYWNYKCILGKVLGAARGVRQVAGWIGPCYFSPDLDRTQCALIRSIAKTDRDDYELGVDEVENMDLRSGVLGQGKSGTTPPSGGYAIIGDYDVPVLPAESFGQFDVAGDDGAMVRIQKIAFKKCSLETVENGSTSDLNPSKKSTPKEPKIYDAAVVFAFAGGANVPVRLRHDVDFVHAPACESGPHALWKGYRTKWVRVDSAGLRDMHGLDGSDFAPEENELDLPSSKALALALGASNTKRSSTGSSGQNRAGDFHQYDVYERDWDQRDDSRSGTEHLQHYVESARNRKFGSREPPSHRRTDSGQLVLRKRDEEVPRRGSQTQYRNDDAHYSDGEESYEGERDSMSSSTSDEHSRPILLIDSTGVSDNEVFARAWCSHWGLDAVVANVSRPESTKGCTSTCVACAVRLAIAARIGVVIFTEGGMADERDRGVWEGDD